MNESGKWQGAGDGWSGPEQNQWAESYPVQHAPLPATPVAEPTSRGGVNLMAVIAGFAVVVAIGAVVALFLTLNRDPAPSTAGPGQSPSQTAQQSEPAAQGLPTEQAQPAPQSPQQGTAKAPGQATARTAPVSQAGSEPEETGSGVPQAAGLYRPSGATLDARLEDSGPGVVEAAQTIVDHGDLINEKDFETAYIYFSPPMAEYVQGLDYWVQGVGELSWRSLVITSVSVDGNSAVVKGRLQTSKAGEWSCNQMDMTWPLQRNGDGDYWIAYKPSAANQKRC